MTAINTYIQSVLNAKKIFINALIGVVWVVVSFVGSTIGYEVKPFGFTKSEHHPMQVIPTIAEGKPKNLLVVKVDDPKMVDNVTRIVAPKTPVEIEIIPGVNEGDPQGIRAIFGDPLKRTGFKTIPPGLSAMSITFEGPKHYPTILPKAIFEV